MAFSIYDNIIQVFASDKGTILTRGEIINTVHTQFGRNKSSIIPSDYCYNRINKGIGFKKHLFEYMTRNEYKYLGPDYKYSGLILAKRKGAQQETIVGEWRGGEPFFFDEEEENSDQVQAYSSSTNEEHLDHTLSFEKIRLLYEKYCSILHLEVEVLGVAPTEARHLIGRIGEFRCVLTKQGRLAHRPNQHGFDVVGPDDRRISVKTTAQSTGFVSFNKNTMDQVQDIMVIQYRNNSFKIIYDGPKEDIIKDARVYDNWYEVDLTHRLLNR